MDCTWRRCALECGRIGPPRSNGTESQLRESIEDETAGRLVRLEDISLDD